MIKNDVESEYNNVESDLKLFFEWCWTMSDVLSNVVRMVFRIIFPLCMSNDFEHSIYTRTYSSIVEMIYRDAFSTYLQYIIVTISLMFARLLMTVYGIQGMWFVRFESVNESNRKFEHKMYLYRLILFVIICNCSRFVMVICTYLLTILAEKTISFDTLLLLTLVILHFISLTINQDIYIFLYDCF